MSTDKFVLSYTHLNGRPKSEQALPMLQKIASLVKPIMRKHSWVLPVLSEFFPESPNLIGERRITDTSSCRGCSDALVRWHLLIEYFSQALVSADYLRNICLIELAIL